MKPEELYEMMFLFPNALREIRYFKSIDTVVDKLIEILESYRYPDSLLKSQALKSLILICDSSDQIKEKVLNNIDYKVFFTMVSQFCANEEQLTSFLSGTSNDQVSYILANMRMDFEKLLVYASEDENIRPKLMKGGVLSHLDIILNDKNGLYLQGAQILNNLSKSEQLSKDLIKYVPIVYDKLITREWESESSLSSNILFASGYEFLKRMVSLHDSEINKKYPHVIENLDELKKLNIFGDFDYESMFNVVESLQSIYDVSYASSIGLVYGSLRAAIHNYIFPQAKKSIFKSGGLRAALGAGFSMMLIQFYEKNKNFFKLNSDTLMLEYGMYATTIVGYLYMLGIVAPYSVLPLIITASSGKSDLRFDIQGGKRVGSPQKNQ